MMILSLRVSTGMDPKRPQKPSLWTGHDDIVYSVHDLEDFHRCGMIPWHKIFGRDGRELVVDSALAAWSGHPKSAGGKLRRAYNRLRELITELFEMVVNEPYEARREQRQEIRDLTSQLIASFIGAIRLRIPTAINQRCVLIEDDALYGVRVLKQLTRDYILQSPSLAAQQKGQQKILTDLFKIFLEDVDSGKPTYLPRKFHYLLKKGCGSETSAGKYHPSIAVTTVSAATTASASNAA